MLHQDMVVMYRSRRYVIEKVCLGFETIQISV